MTKREKIAYLESKGWHIIRKPHEPVYFIDPMGLETTWGGMRLEMAFKLQSKRDEHQKTERKRGT